MALWKQSSTVVATALLVGLLAPLAPPAYGQDAAIVVPVTHSCQSIYSGSDVEKEFKIGLGTGQGGANQVVVRYPAQVAPGEVFTAYVQPGAMTTATGPNNQYEAGRLSYDVAIPTNATILGVDAIGGEMGISSGSSALRIDRYDSLDGWNGPVARIWGGTTVVLNTNTTGVIESGYWDAGLRVNGGATFRFPELALRMRAPVTGIGESIAVGLKGAGSHTRGSATNGALNTFQGAHRSGYTIGSYWWSSRFYCSSSQNASALTSTLVSGSSARYLAKTSTVMTSAGAHLPRSARTPTLSAKVSTTEELMSNVRAGGAMMRFDIKDVSTGTVIGSPTASINPDGTASTNSFRFPDISAGEVRDNYEVTATYTGRADDIEASTSSPASYSVGYNEINATVALSSTNGQLANGTMPVTLKADVTPPSGRSFPANLQIQLYKDDQPYGAPLPVPSGTGTKQIAFPVDTLTQAQNTKTYRYRAEIVPLIINDLDRYAGQSAVSVAAIVTGTNPGSPLPEGGGGSADLQNIFLAPKLVWEWLSGSVGRAGAFSTAFN